MGLNNPLDLHVVYEFGDFRLDARRRLLFAKGQKDALIVAPKVIAALLLFIEHRGELLTKDRLMAELWPGRIVEENSLTRIISQLRHALGEEPGENVFLATESGFGYRFTADVARSEVAGDPQVGHAEPVPAAPRRQPRRVWTLALVSGFGIVLLVFGWLFLWRPTEEVPESPSESASESASESRPVLAELPSRTIAVLPFESLGADDEHDYIAFGIAESVLHRLANIRELTVIARSSSFADRDSRDDAREIGRTLNARYLIEGSLQSFVNRLRITVQVIDASTGSHVLSLQFDRPIEDIFGLEDEIAQGVADALQVNLVEQQHPYAAYGTEAYLAYLQGRALIASRKVDDAERAVKHFSRAVTLAPEFAAAYVAMADAYRHVGYLEAHGPGRSPLYWDAGPRGEALKAAASKAEPLVDKALELDETLGEAYVLRADLKAISGDMEGAEADYRQGLSLAPSFGDGHLHFAEFLERHNRDVEAHAEFDKAILLDPLSPQGYYLKGFMYMFSEEREIFSEQAEAYFLKALQVAPDFHPAMVRIGAIRWHQGRFAEAILLAERALAIDPRSNWIRWFLVEFYLEVGDVEAARHVLVETLDPVPPTQWMAVCLYEQDLERAAELLRADPHIRTFADNDIEVYIVRDRALARLDPEAGLHELVPYAEQGIAPEGSVFLLAAVVQLSSVLGRRSEAEHLAEMVLEFRDPRARSSAQFRIAYPRAAALTLLGRDDAALDLLEESYARGFRKRWWYAFDRDPAFEPLRSSARFKALAAQAHAHAAAERERLEELRKRSDIPARRVTAGSTPATC